MILRVRALALGATLLALTIAVAPARALAARAPGGGRVSVQPIDGQLGPALRGEIARLLRGHGYRAVTTLSRVGGTGEYLTLARDHHLAAFVTADLEEGRRSARITFLVWDGVTGSVQGRWTASASARRLPKIVAKGFWKTLGPRFQNLEAPPSDDLAPAAPMYVNAGEPSGE